MTLTNTVLYNLIRYTVPGVWSINILGRALVFYGESALNLGRPKFMARPKTSGSIKH